MKKLMVIIENLVLMFAKAHLIIRGKVGKTNKKERGIC